MHLTKKLYYKNLPISIKKIVWGALATSIFFVLKAYTNHLINAYNYEFSWVLISLKTGITYFIWVVLTPLVYQLTNTLQNTKVNISIKIFKFLLGAMLLAFFHQLLISRLNDGIYYLNSGYFKSFLGHNNLVVLVIGSFSSFIELLVISAVFLASDYQKKYILNQKALIAAQLNALRMQLQPHFLFNTLHSIAAMIDIDTKNAQKMLSKLGLLLRNMLEYDAEQMVTVKEELNFIKDYLDLEQVRYQDRITIKYNISEETLSLKVPSMIFQPLVENAIKYGVIPTVDEGEININIHLEYCDILQERGLILEITNTVHIQNGYKKPEGTGLGLKNVNKRLQQFYDNAYTFNAHFETPDVYIAKIIVPIIKQL
ncbi:sensor histidine kinase [Aquimarina algiphila]|uniref:sensor histidine kinase n=1 Tax=Aquimarina algiphila TaxID=2047982 RepID=UPI002330EDCA|nr:histidine kinase [Aquimarina algiphila]